MRICIANTFTHRRFYTQKLLHTEAFTHRSFYTEAITHRSFYPQKLLHTDAFTHRCFYTDAFTRTLLHTDTFTHRHFYTQTLLHTDAFTHIAILLQFLAIQPHFVRQGDVRKGRGGQVEIALEIAILPSVFADRTSFRAKGLRGTS